MVLSAVLALTACSSVTSEQVKIAPLKYNITASKIDLYLAAVDCTLENISSPTTNGQFFDYKDKESGRLSVAFNSSYVIAFSPVPLKTTMSIKVAENNLTIKFSNLVQHFDHSTNWVPVFQEKDGSVSKPELIMTETANNISSCVKENV